MSSNRPKHLKFDSQIKGAPSVDQRVRGACVRVTTWKAHTARTSIDTWPAINMDKGLLKITFRRFWSLQTACFPVKKPDIASVSCLIPIITQILSTVSVLIERLHLDIVWKDTARDLCPFYSFRRRIHTRIDIDNNTVSQFRDLSLPLHLSYYLSIDKLPGRHWVVLWLYDNKKIQYYDISLEISLSTIDVYLFINKAYR